MRVLIVEDERKLGQFVCKGLEEASYSATLVSTCQGARDAVSESEYDVVILDLGLPDGSGFELLREWRSGTFNNYVLILSARGAVDDKVKGLNLGADDYLGKPFSFDELLARVRSLTRRQSRQRTTVLEHGPIRMDLVKREVKIGKNPVYLTQREYALLEIFLQNPGRVLTRTMLSEKIWNCYFDTGTNLVDVYVGRLRAKLGVEPHSFIASVRGVGYRLA